LTVVGNKEMNEMKWICLHCQ